MNLNKTTLISFLVLMALTSIVAFMLAYPFLLSVTMGGIISLMLRPFYLKLLNQKIGAKSASLLLTTAVVILVILPLTLLTIIAVKQGITIGHAVSNNENFSSHVLLSKINQWPPVNMFFDDAGVFESKAQEWIESSLKFLTTSLLFMFSQVPSIILQLLFVAISCFFFLLDGEKLLKWMSNKIPLEHDVRKKLSASFTDTAISSIWATLAAGASQSIVMFIAYLVLGVPAAILAGGLTFIFAWIPMVGCTPIWAIASIYLFSKGLMIQALLMVLFGFVAGLIDNVVRPLILKGRSKIHPMISLISIFGGIGMFGIVGVFIGPVIAAFMISLLKLWSEIGSRFGLLPKP